MNRSKKIIVVSNCLLNSNSKVRPLAKYKGVLCDVMDSYIEDGVGILQLPCPETSYLGMNRWGMCREQYDHPNFHRHCRNILAASLDQIEAFIAAGYEILGVIGVDGSPNCGVSMIPSGLSGGEISFAAKVSKEVENLQFLEGTGVFMTMFEKMLSERNISLQFMAVDENNPSSSTIKRKGE